MNSIKTVVLAAATLGGSLVAQAQVINTFPVWDGTTSLSPFGEPSFATVGQVFTVDPNFTQLDVFAFAVRHESGGPVNFGAVLTEWDPIGLRPALPVLFFQNPGAIAPSVTTFTPVFFNTGGVVLSGGTQYVAFLTASPFFDSVFDVAALGFLGFDPYSGGGAVAFDNGTDLGVLISAPWIVSGDDLAFAAAFSRPVPEPSTYGVLGALLLGGLVALRRRWRR